MDTRRQFLKKTSLMAGSGLLASYLPNSAYAIFNSGIMPNEQLNIAVIGAKGMGWSNVNAAMKIPSINLIGICDVDKNVIDSRLADLSKQSVDTNKIKRYGDYRALLDNKDIDAVIIGTPDHWHALQMIHACEAGKDVYVEKPVGNSIVECNRMVDAQIRYNKVVQAGQWQRSQKHFKDAVDFIHSGQLGNIRTVKTWCYQGGKKPGAVVPNSPAPAGVDYEQWLGPAPVVPFNASRFHYNFRWFWDYAGGLMTDWGVHLLDYALLGMKTDFPKSIVGLGGRFAYPDLYEETPDTLTTLYEFDKFNVVWDSAMGVENGPYNRDHGIAYIGNNGTLILNRAGWEVIEEKKSQNKVVKPFIAVSDKGLQNHMQNFIDVIKSRKMEDLKCSIQAGSHVATIAQMGNISYRSGQKLVWDKNSNSFTDNKINKLYLEKEYHNGYKLPRV